HWQRLDSDPADMQPMFENNVKCEAGHDGDAVIPNHTWRCGDRPLRPPIIRDAVCNGPGKESTEEHDVDQHTGRYEMCQRPQHDADEHRMLECALDATREIRGQKQRKHGKHQNGSDVLSPSRWRVQDYRVLCRDAVAPDDDYEARDRHQRIKA